MARKKKEEKIELPNNQIANEIVRKEVADFVEESYIPYSYYVIHNRALIRAEEGLKPVHRRIFWGMYQNKIFPEKPTVKTATVAGNVCGLYHPHGNASVEDAIARLCQDFNMRVPLLDYQGSVGFLTGDEASAPRYYEVKLNKASMELLKELDSDCVPMIPNYCNTGLEPVVLPARFPVSLVNGTIGIAVGYASNMPPHNPTEVMDACVARLENPDLTIDELLKIMPGPDFPTAGEIFERDAIRQYYETGKGTFVVRGKYRIEPNKSIPGSSNIVFYELPYQIPASKVIEQVQKAISKDDKTLKGISEIKDLSDKRRGLALTITTKPGTNAKLIVQRLFAKTDAEKKFSVNNTCLANGLPRQVSMFQLIDSFLDFRRECIYKRTKNRIEMLQKQVDRNEGILKVILVDVDKAIEIIRKSKTTEDATKKLMKTFKVTEEQATSVLNMRIRVLTNADSMKLKQENDELEKELAELKKIVKDDDLLDERVKEELLKTREVIKDKRRTTIRATSTEKLKDTEKQINKLHKILESNADCFIALDDNNDIKYSLTKMEETDIPFKWQYSCKTQSNLYMIDKHGNNHMANISFLPLDKKTNISVLGVEPDDLVGLGFELTEYDTEDKMGVGLLVVTNKGNVNIIKGELDKNPVAVKLGKDEEIIYSEWITDEVFETKNLAMTNSKGLIAILPLNLIRQSNAGAGTIIGMGTDCDLVGASVVDSEGLILSMTNENKVKLTNLSEIPVKRTRGIKGVILTELGSDEELILCSFGKKVVANSKVKLPEVTPRTRKGTKMELDVNDLKIYR